MHLKLISILVMTFREEAGYAEMCGKTERGVYKMLKFELINKGSWVFTE